MYLRKNNYLKQRNANTDNKGKLFVTVFAFATSTKCNTPIILDQGFS